MAPSQDKLGGLLIEPVRSGTGPAVMGIGINVNAGEDRLPIGAASLAGITGRPWDRHRLAAELLAGCVHWWDRFLEEGFAPVARAWEGHALWLGEPVRVTGETGTVSGTMAGMDDWGRLRLQTAEGERRLTAGDVSLRRQ
jgi:BirA family biotin operon repressor/biotin-[acetyl-CoA-carboxylase] ligase